MQGKDYRKAHRRPRLLAQVLEAPKVPGQDVEEAPCCGPSQMHDEQGVQGPLNGS
jgi:hypothetical protein